MQSTVIINCTKGRVGLFFSLSSAITIQGLTFINCGVCNYHASAAEYFCATHLFTWINSLILVHVSIQKSSGHRLKVYNCNKVKI